MALLTALALGLKLAVHPRGAGGPEHLAEAERAAAHALAVGGWSAAGTVNLTEDEAKTAQVFVTTACNGAVFISATAADADGVALLVDLHRPAGRTLYLTDGRLTVTPPTASSRLQTSVSGVLAAMTGVRHPAMAPRVAVVATEGCNQPHLLPWPLASDVGAG